MPEEIAVNNLEPNMRVIHPVYSQGMLLVHAGTQLTDGLIQTLKKRGVESAIIETEEDRQEEEEEVVVEEEPVSPLEDPEISEKGRKSLASAFEKLDVMFAGLEDEPAMHNLKIAAAQFWQKRMRDQHGNTNTGIQKDAS